MQHLDEGLLHAYLDGGLTADGQQSRDADAAEHSSPSIEQVELHIQECADCRQRLEEARRIKDSAAGILSGSGPTDMTKPSFDELVARARARKGENAKGQRGRGAEGQRLRLRSMRSLALAAVVVLAAATGWYARSALLRDEQGRFVTESSGAGQLTVGIPQTESDESLSDRADNQDALDQAAAQITTAQETEGGVSEFRAEQEAVPTVVGGVTAIATVPSAAPPEPGVTVDEPAEGRAAFAKGVRDGQISTDTDSSLRELMGQGVTAESTVLVEAAAEPDRLRRERAASPAPQQAPSAPMASLVAVRGVSSQSDANDLSWSRVDAETAATLIGQPVPIVEDLEIVSYEMTSVAGVRAVRVFQMLESGTLVELIVSDRSVADLFDPNKRMAPEDVMAVEDAAATNTTTVLRGALTVRLSAPLPTDSLSELGQRLRFP